VGDPAQSSWPQPAAAAEAQAAALRGKERRTFHLSTNYRNSKEIFELAAALARQSLPEADLPVAVRATGVLPSLRRVEPDHLPSEFSAAVASLSEEVDGTIGVVVPRSLKEQARRWLGHYDRDRIVLLEPIDTKGLEFDAALVVEPDLFVAESPRGLATLYVVLTRATSRLDVVETTLAWRPHCRPLPAPDGGGA
jgi:DNA helicase IV